MDEKFNINFYNDTNDDDSSEASDSEYENDSNLSKKENKINEIIKKQIKVLRRKLNNFYEKINLEVNPSIKISVFLNKQEAKKLENKDNKTKSKKTKVKTMKEKKITNDGKFISSIGEDKPYKIDVDAHMKVIIQFKREATLANHEKDMVLKQNGILIKENEELKLINKYKKESYCENCLRITKKFNDQLGDLEQKLNSFLGLSGLKTSHSINATNSLKNSEGNKLEYIENKSNVNDIIDDSLGFGLFNDQVKQSDVILDIEALRSNNLERDDDSDGTQTSERNDDNDSDF